MRNAPLYISLLLRMVCEIKNKFSKKSKTKKIQI